MAGKSVAVIGGGAAGFFAAISCAETNPDHQVTIFEKSPKLLSKVKISGGGRCNVTNGCTDARQLISYYPRGGKQLLGPLTRFGTADTMAWFEQRGVKLKIEDDSRVFPVTDSSQTIIDCLLEAAQHSGVEIKASCGLNGLTYLGQTGRWQLNLDCGTLEVDAVILAPGSSARIWKILETLGHPIVPPVPSLFTFNIKSELIRGLEGLSVSDARVSIQDKSGLNSSGPLLITHWGLSGPAILKLSAWGARHLAVMNYHFDLQVNWTGLATNDIANSIRQFKEAHPKKNVTGNPLFDIPRRLWERMTKTMNVNYADLSNKKIEELAQALTATQFQVNSKSTFKDEFVTAGGVDLNEVDFKTMQSKKFPGLYFAGEVMDIDALTGGFNFQAAWTTGWIAGTSV